MLIAFCIASDSNPKRLSEVGLLKSTFLYKYNFIQLSKEMTPLLPFHRIYTYHPARGDTVDKAPAMVEVYIPFSSHLVKDIPRSKVRLSTEYLTNDGLMWTD